jgi:Asp-tRNA(Asn)/Glu-tRNA(Gln) amidotransferase A subunit family amidase
VAAVTGAARLCEELGHVVTEDRPEWDEEARIAAARVIIFAHTRAELDEAERRRGRPATPDDVEPMVWFAAERGREASAVDMAEAVATLHRVGRQVGRFFTRHDVLLTPTQCRVPPRLGVLDMCTEDRDGYVQALMASIAFTAPFNGTGNPAMSVPLHWAEDGVPVGVQFVAPFGDEATLFRLGSQLERARPWADRRPPPLQSA